MEMQAELEMKVNKLEDHFKLFLKHFRSGNKDAALAMLNDVKAKTESVAMWIENGSGM